MDSPDIPELRPEHTAYYRHLWTLPGLLLYPLVVSGNSVASCVCKLAQREAIIDLSKVSLIQTPRSLRSPRSLPGAIERC